jgi:ketosteroid isomerase-like protein
MRGDDNIKTIQAIYEAFGRGDIATILEGVTDEVDWAAEAASGPAPWYGVRHGRSEVAAFFEQFGSTMEVREFTPVSFAANDTEVHTLVRFRAVSRSTGKEVDQNLHHYFRFQGGKIEYYRGSEDTAQVEAAFRP